MTANRENPPSDPRPETEHVRSALRGETEGLEWLVERFTPLIEAQIRYRLGAGANAHDVEDLTVETWVVTLSRLTELDPREGRYSPVVVKFLSTTALQLSNNHLRRLVRRRTRGEGPGLEESIEEDAVRRTRSILSSVAGRDLVHRVREAIEGMDADRRDVLVLRLIEQRENAEVAETLGVEPNTAAVRYRRALEHLRERLPSSLVDELTGH